MARQANRGNHAGCDHPHGVACVAFPMAIPGIYDYRVPAGFADRAAEGVPVLVEVKTRKIWGVIVEIKTRSDFPDLKPLLDLRGDIHLKNNRSLIELYQWMAAYYQCGLGKVFKPYVRKRLMDTAVKLTTVYSVAQSVPAALSEKQKAALAVAASMSGELTRQRLVDEGRLSDHMIGTLVEKVALLKVRKTVVREADENSQTPDAYKAGLSPEQQEAYEHIRRGFDDPVKPYLLHGITGSGKTHVYIELVRHALGRGRGVIVLVPEIALTPQTIRRFKGAVGEAIAVIHSHMSEGERRDSLEDLVTGKKRIAVGVRSAVLAPVRDLGLIIVDEEHDGSYKQSDPDPRYHARDVAVMRGRLQGAVVVLGSATPSLETWHNAQNGKFEYVTLLRRYGEAVLPRVDVVDMNGEHRDNNWTFLSRLLKERIEAAVGDRRQVILLLNRRGFSTFLLCKDCGHIYACPFCSVNLVYHRSDLTLKCHQCGYAVDAPSVCGKCGGEHIQYKGTGIQKAEEHLRSVFPAARIIRMDQDTTRRKGSHVAILEEFAQRRADILLGTQMISKGLDFPGVALVGVLQADVGLHIPDFRSSERTFQLLTQVAGRAGRADKLGEVVIQTYLPHEPSIQASMTHDYETFVTREMEKRRELSYPPFCRLARILTVGCDRDRAWRLIEEIAAELRGRLGQHAALLGPAPAIVSQIRSAFRFSLLIKSKSSGRLQQALSGVRQKFTRMPAGVKMIIDVDPTGML